MSERIQVVVPRLSSNDETTFAIVSCDKTENVQLPRDVFENIRDAVTHWVRNTDSGRAAYEDSARDFNVGDLWHYLDDFALLRALRVNGIVNLTVETYSHLGETLWQFDDRLVQ